jgi:hypothetical protein
MSARPEEKLPLSAVMSGSQTTGKIVRVMSFHLNNGMTGWMFSTLRVRSNSPNPKSLLS